MSALLTQFLMVRMSLFYCGLLQPCQCQATILVVSVFSGHLSTTVFQCQSLSTQPYNTDRVVFIFHYSRVLPQLADGHSLQLGKVPANMWNKLQFRCLMMTLIHQFFAKFDCVSFIDPEYWYSSFLWNAGSSSQFQTTSNSRGLKASHLAQEN